MDVDHELATSSTPPKITNVSDVYKRFGLKLCDSDETGKSFRYECVPSAQILINEQLLGPTKLVTVIISFGDEQFAESVVSTKDDAAILAKIEIAIEKQIQKLRTLADLRPLGGLLSLPDELLTNVLSRLDAKALARASRTCKKMKELADSDQLWRRLYFQDFTTIGADDERTWRTLYSGAVRAKKERERATRPRSSASAPIVDPLAPNVMPHPMIGPPGHMPGMIGGEYDLRPGVGMAGPFRNPIRGDPIVPGNLIDPDQGRRDPDRPDFPQDIPRGGFNPDGSFDDGTFGFPRRGPGRPGRGNRPFDPFGGGGFM